MDAPPPAGYPLRFTVDYPDRPLSRLTTAFRPFVVIPIAIVLCAVTNASGGLLVLAPALMIVFRQKYPRWWFDFNRELLRFSNRIWAYALLMDDRYPSTDEEQYAHLNVGYPDVPRELNRWLPIVKWFLAIPHFVVLAFLWIGVVVAVIAAWFAILFTGRYPRVLFDFVEGVLRWGNRVVAYSALLVTDRYPPFRLAE
jgi:hypothetical protein